MEIYKNNYGCVHAESKSRVIKEDDDSMLCKAMLHEASNEHDQAYQHFLPLAEKGNAFAQLHVGLMYKEGRGVLQNDKEAFNWLEKAAEQNNADQTQSAAQTELGKLYANGIGISKDYEKAIDLFASAYERGFGDAANELGKMHALGHGVTKNYAQAFIYFEKAYDQLGCPAAAVEIGKMHALGYGKPAEYSD